ncbi:MAG TPA: hypothetical protein VE010_01620, partial [Thermoanaerobaculia bacterium]|nr:hypothetical protein [Thermoanaerobaculia bacterium]
PSTDRTADGRQPLPSTFAVRWINGGAGDFHTSLKIWRNGVTGANAGCSAYARNGEIEFAEVVAFDEDENGEGKALSGICSIIPTCPADEPVYLRSMLVSITDDDIFPMPILRDVTRGWIYLNLDDTTSRFDVDPLGPHQNWIVATMRAEGRFSVDLTAAALGNGCSPIAPATEYSYYGDGGVFPGPAEDITP